jgi:Flp pilus assembly protein TadD
VRPDDRYKAMYGRMLFELKECGPAESALREVAPRMNMPEVYNLHALSALCLGQSDAARASFQKSLQLKPDQPVIQKALADINQGGRPVR